MLLELGLVKASTPLIVPGQEHFLIQARRPPANPREKPGLAISRWLPLLVMAVSAFLATELRSDLASACTAGELAAGALPRTERFARG